MAEASPDRRSVLRWALAIPASLALVARRGFAAAPAACVPTQDDIQGPMYVPGAPRRSILAPPNEPGERLRVRGTIYGPDCKTPLRKALLDVWQADAKGNYHGENEAYRLRGQILTNDRGEYEFDTVKPGSYGDARGMRPAHIHFTISNPGHEPLTTQLYFKGDPYLGHDFCSPRCHSDDPHRIIELARGVRGLSGTFDVVLKGTA
jgi:catechol 1,2-dioxygenase